MLGFKSLNSGEARYLSNSEFQSAAERGGREPVTGFHSVILSLRFGLEIAARNEKRTYPDSVSLVKPPNTTIPKTLAADPRSQYATVFEEVSGKNLALAFSFPGANIFSLKALRGDLSPFPADFGKVAALLLNRMVCRIFAFEAC